MTKFLELTSTDAVVADKKTAPETLIRVDGIIAVYFNIDTNETRVWVSGGQEIAVKESYEVVKVMIHEALRKDQDAVILKCEQGEKPKTELKSAE